MSVALKYKTQSGHNFDFLREIKNAFRDDFFDWKINVSYYCALHHVKSYLTFNGIPESDLNHHSKVYLQLDNFHGIPSGVSDAFFFLMNQCDSSRYAGFVKYHDFNKAMESSFGDCEKSLRIIRDNLNLSMIT